MKQESASPTLSVSWSIIETLERVCLKIGATVLVEPEWKCVGQINYKSGVRRYFRTSTLDINTMAASAIARDKEYTRFFLRSMGYPVIEGKSFFTEEWAAKLKVENRGIDAAWEYAKELGLPVFVKPNSKSRGLGVSFARDQEEFIDSASVAFRNDKVVLIERLVAGKDYRVVVLDGKVISAYHRIPLTIVGDGTSKISELIDQTEQRFRKEGREETINRSDFRIKRTLKRKNLTSDSVLPKGVHLTMLENANLSSGGTSVDVTDVISPGFKNLARGVSSDMGLRLVGVDIMVDGRIDAEPESGKHWIIEINSAPGLDHYASLGIAQQGIVDDLYHQVVVAMERPEERID